MHPTEPTQVTSACRHSRVVGGILLGALLLASHAGVAAASDPQFELALSARLGEAWRWRAIEPHYGRNRLDRLWPGTSGEMLAADGEQLVCFNGWDWDVIPLHLETDWSLKSALPWQDGWLISTRFALYTTSETRGQRELYACTDGTGHTRPVVDQDGRILVGIQGHLQVVTADGFEALIAAPDGAGRLLELTNGFGGEVLAVMQRGLFALADEALGEHAWVRLDPPGSWPESYEPHHVVRGGHNLYLLPNLLDAERPGMLWDGLQLRPLAKPPVAGVDVIEDAASYQDGTLVLATRHARLLLYRDGMWEKARPAAPVDREYIVSICPLGDRLVVLTGSGRVYSCDLASQRWAVYGKQDIAEEHIIINALNGADDDQIWVASEQGIGLWSGEDWAEFHRPVDDQLAPFEAFTTVCLDDDGHLWTGSGSGFGGALEYDGHTWTHHNLAEGFKDLPVHRIVRGPEGELWFALLTEFEGRDVPGGGLMRKQGDTWTHFTTEDGLPHNRTFDVAFAPDGTAWVSTYQGLARQSDEGWQSVKEPGAPQMSLFSLHFDHTGRLFAGRGLSETGVFVRNVQGRWSLLSTKGKSVMCAAQFAETADGTVYFSGDGGLFRIEGDLAVECTAPQASPVSNFWPLVPDGHNGLWLGSRGDGLVHYTPEDHDAPRVLQFHPMADFHNGSVSTRWKGTDFWNVTLPRDVTAELCLNNGDWVPEMTGQALVQHLTPGRHRVGLRLTDEQRNTSKPVIRDIVVPDLHRVRRTLQVSGTFLLMAICVLGISAWLRGRERRRESKRLEAVTLRLMNSQEDERRSLSRDLHDDLGQLLTAATLDLEMVGRAPDEAGRTQARQRALSTVRSALERTRKFSAVLRPRMLDELGFEQALRSALDEFRERTGLELSAHIDLGPERLPEPLSGHLYRVVQEALTNVARHAQATHVDISMWLQDGQLVLEFSDDGIGIERTNRSASDGQGLAIMAERIKQLGGKLTVSAGPEKGTQIRLFVPAPFSR